MSEITKTVGELIVSNVSLAVVIILWILSGLFKLVKIEINPIGWLVGIIGRAFTKDIKTDVIEVKSSISELKDTTDKKISDLKLDLDKLEKKTNESIEQMQKSNDLQTVRQIRAHVLDFANSCRNGRKHTHEDFRNILEENSEYEELVKKYNIKNDCYTEDFKYIKRIYQNCLDNNSFLA